LVDGARELVDAVCRLHYCLYAKPAWPCDDGFVIVYTQPAVCI